MDRRADGALPGGRRADAHRRTVRRRVVRRELDRMGGVRRRLHRRHGRRAALHDRRGGLPPPARAVDPAAPLGDLRHLPGRRDVGGVRARGLPRGRLRACEVRPGHGQQAAARGGALRPRVGRGGQDLPSVALRRGMPLLVLPRRGVGILTSFRHPRGGVSRACKKKEHPAENQPGALRLSARGGLWRWRESNPRPISYSYKLLRV